MERSVFRTERFRSADKEEIPDEYTDCRKRRKRTCNCMECGKKPKADKIYCAPGNAGISQYAECVNIGAMEFEKLADFAQEHSID